MVNRPYFNTSIEEMEAAFARKSSKSQTFDLMLHELSFRNTQRDIALKELILASNKSSSKRNQKACRSNTQSIHQAKPSVTNAPENILRAWTALEVLSPQGYQRESELSGRDNKLVARFDETDLPWELGESPPPKKRLYFELILGAIPLAPAVHSLLQVYDDNRPEKPSMKGHCPIASIVLDNNGCPLDEQRSIAVSSFAWGMPIALRGDLKRLGDWPDEEGILVSSFRRQIIRRDNDNEIRPLTKGHIRDLFQHVVDELGLSAQELRPPYFALRRYQFFKNEKPPEPSLLNSFFLQDLEMARIHAMDGDLPHALRHYLGAEEPPRKTDLLKDQNGLRRLLQPALTPPGRWPGNGRYPLALLQQAAVNATEPEEMETGVLAVNGPPGTGKTTLLRDVVAARIVDRAVVMSSYSRPADAFTSTSESLRRSGATITLHELDERLKGFEMVVASSNNKAVENVSAELPGMDAIADDATELRYFKTVSDSILGRDTWGLIAAVLGNSSNRYTFSQNFWAHEECGLSTYLNHASGTPQMVSEPQKSGTLRKRNRKIVDRENPPSDENESAERWEKARRNFQHKVNKSKRNTEKLQVIYEQIEQLDFITTEIDEIIQNISDIKFEIEILDLRYSDAKAALDVAEQDMATSRRATEMHISTRPRIWARLLRTSKYGVWLKEHKELEEKLTNHKKIVTDFKKTFRSIDMEREDKNKSYRDIVEKMAKLKHEKT